MRNALFLTGLAAVATAQDNNVQVGEGFIRFPVTVTELSNVGSLSSKRQTAVDLTQQQQGTSYTIQLGIGSTSQPVVVQLDTGSTDLWVNPNCANANGANQIAFCNTLPRFTPALSTTYQDTGSRYTLTYGIGNATVEYVRDTVRAGSATLTAQIFGNAINSYLEPFGILGIGPYLQGNPSYPFFIDQLKAQGKTNSRAFSLDLRSIDSAVGSIIFGGIDTGKYIGNLEKLPIIPASSAPDGASRYWVSVASVSTGTKTLSTGAFSVILDSGTTLSYLPSYLHTAIGNNFPTARLDSSGFYIVDCAVAQQSGSVDFKFGGKTIQVAYKDFIWRAGTNLCVIGTLPTSGIFILGDSFLRAAYAVFDQDNSNIHLAQAANCGTNLIAIGSGANAVPSSAGQCNAATTSSTTSSTSSTSSSTTSSSTSQSSTTTTSSSSSSSTSGSSSTSRSSTASSTSSSSATSRSSSSVSGFSNSTVTSRTSTTQASVTTTSRSGSLTTTARSGSSSSTASQVTSTLKITTVYTITACPVTVTNCPLGKVTTEIFTSYTTFCPGTVATAPTNVPIPPPVTVRSSSGVIVVPVPPVATGVSTLRVGNTTVVPAPPAPPATVTTRITTAPPATVPGNVPPTPTTGRTVSTAGAVKMLANAGAGIAAAAVAVALL